jgi:hypothetical protein
LDYRRSPFCCLGLGNFPHGPELLNLGLSLGQAWPRGPPAIVLVDVSIDALWGARLPPPGCQSGRRRYSGRVETS